MQALLVLVAAGLLVFSGYAWGRAAGFTAGAAADPLDAAPGDATGQVVVLVVLGLGALAAAFALQTEGGVRLLTPARLDALEKAGAVPALAPDGEPEAAQSD
jgi:hypothetical protein